MVSSAPVALHTLKGLQISADPFGPLRLRFTARCREQLAVLKAAARSQKGLAAGLGDLLKIAHSLAGGGGTFGFPELSERASYLETLLSDESEADPSKVRASLDALILELERIPE